MQVIFEVEIAGVGRSIKSLDELKQAVKDASVEAGKSEFGSKQHVAAQKTLSNLQHAQLEYTKQTKDLVKEKQAEDLSYRGLSTRLNIMRDAYRDMAVQGKGGTKEARELRSEIAKLDNQLKGIDASTGVFVRNVGNYASAFGKVSDQIGRVGVNIISSFGITSAADLFSTALKNAAQVVKEFDAAQTELAALSGKSREEIQALTEDAKKLGATTLFTATDVSKLQVELSKLGFSEGEILKSTKAVIDFAVALDANAGDAATVAASTLRAFGLEASETERVVSVLGVAANKTSLGFEDFESNIATFATVAKSLGFSLEDSIALFGSLRNAGFEASTAATAMRNIFLNLADANGKLAQRLGEPVRSLDQLIPALSKLRAQGVDLADTLELTDKRSVAAFNQLLNGADTLDDLRDSLTGVNDEFQAMVDQRLGSVESKLKLLNSSWEGFILSVEDGEGAISTAFGNAVEGATAFLSILTALNDGVVSFGDVFNSLFGGPGIKDLVERQENIAKVAVQNAERLSEILKSGSAEEKIAAHESIKQLEERAAAGSKNAKLVIDALKRIDDAASENTVITDTNTVAIDRNTKSKKESEKAAKEKEKADREEIKTLKEKLTLFELENQTEITPKSDLTGEAIANEKNRLALILKERMKVLDREKELGLISETAYKVEATKIRNALQKDLQALGEKGILQGIQELELELDLRKETNEEILDLERELSEEQFKIAKSRLEKLEEQELHLSQVRFENGLISYQEHLNAQIDITNDYYRQRKALDDLYEEDQKAREKRAEDRHKANAENILIINRDFDESEFDAKRDAVQQQLEAEIEAAEERKEAEIKAGEESVIADDNFNLAKVLAYQAASDKILAIDEAEKRAKLSNAANVLGKISELLGKHTLAGKLAAIVEATINTYVAATTALRDPTLPTPARFIAAAAAIIVGLKQVAAIKKIKAEHGLSVSPDGQATTFKEGLIHGPSHSRGGVKGSIHGVPVEAEGGEIFAYDKAGNAHILNIDQQRTAAMNWVRYTNFAGTIPNAIYSNSTTEFARRDHVAGLFRAQEGFTVGRPEGFVSGLAGNKSFEDRIVDRIGAVVFNGTRQGAMLGSSQGIAETNREALSQERFRKQRTIG